MASFTLATQNIIPFSRKHSVLYLSLDSSVEGAKPYPIERAEELLQFSYTPGLIFENQRTEKKVKDLCKKSLSHHFVKPNTLWLGQLHSKEILLGHIPSLAVCWNDAGIGYGVFARETIPAWSFLGEYAGILRKQNKLFGIDNNYCFRYPLSASLISYFSLDSGHFGSFTRFINHSDKPNAEAISIFCKNIYRVIIRSTKTIKKGTEITYNYGPLYWGNRKKRFELVEQT